MPPAVWPAASRTRSPGLTVAEVAVLAWSASVLTSVARVEVLVVVAM